jgi:hypothetical protein
VKNSILAFSFLAACGLAQPQNAQELDQKTGLASITAKEIQAHVNHLASDELKGRSAKSPEGKLAAAYVAKHFKESGLEPFGDEKSFFQKVPGFSPNVVGIVRGSGEGYVIVSAHYDHLAPKKEGKEGEDRIYNGADDNASGTSGVLELAQALGGQKGRLSASIVFIGFTAEEGGLRGSKYFAAQAPMDLKLIRGVYNMDMISRGKKNLIFCVGGDKAPAMLASIKTANKRIKLDVRYDEHPEWIRQSDQYSFIEKGVAALYFGVEDHVDYHKVSDHADKILPELSAKVTQLIYLAATDLAAKE